MRSDSRLTARRRQSMRQRWQTRCGGRCISWRASPVRWDFCGGNRAPVDCGQQISEIASGRVEFCPSLFVAGRRRDGSHNDARQPPAHAIDRRPGRNHAFQSGTMGGGKGDILLFRRKVECPLFLPQRPAKPTSIWSRACSSSAIAELKQTCSGEGDDRSIHTFSSTGDRHYWSEKADDFAKAANEVRGGRKRGRKRGHSTFPS